MIDRDLIAELGRIIAARVLDRLLARAALPEACVPLIFQEVVTATEAVVDSDIGVTLLRRAVTPPGSER